MGKVGKISVIPKDYSNAYPTMETSLRNKGFSRFPGTKVMKFPAKTLSGRYKTGLDEHADNILAIQDPQERARKQKSIIELREKLENKLGVSLSPDSKYYNYTSNQDKKVSGFQLIDGDNIFNLDIDKYPEEYVTFLWLSVHPTIASSYEAYLRGEYTSDTTFYVKDDDLENEIKYRKNKNESDAIIKFDSLSIEKRKKVMRCMGLPVTEDSKEGTDYNQFIDIIKKQELLLGPYKGQSPLTVFSRFVDLDPDELKIRDSIEQALSKQIYREGKAGKIYEGEMVVFDGKNAMIDYFLDEKNQGDYLELENKLKFKRLASI